MSRATVREAVPPDFSGYRFIGPVHIRHVGAGGNARVFPYEQNLPHRKVAVR